MTDWTEIFRAGRHTDSAGATREWTEGDLAAIAASYDPSYSDAPAVIGHPETNSPAYGWVSKLKAEGGRLLAKFRQLDPGFVDAIRAGRFKHRSVALYPDLDGRGLYLRHVGFLGATPPAVKGLAAAQFKEGDSIAFEFSIGGDEQMDESKLRSVFSEMIKPITDFMEKFKGTAATAAPPATTDPPAVGSAAFNEAVKAAVTEQVTPLTANFNAQIQQRDDRIAALETQLKTAAASGTKAAVDALIHAAAQDGRWIPAFDKDGTREMVYAMAGNQPLEFGEAGADGKRQSLDGIGQVKSYLAKLPKKVQFGEMTGDAGDNRQRGKLVSFNAPVDGKTQVSNLDLAERAEAIRRDKKIEYAEALVIARQEMAS